MKRTFIGVVIAALAIGAGGYAWRVIQRGGVSASSAVTALMPRDTLALVHLPDFNQTRDDWKRSDIYQLYAEPAVQEFLRQPLAHQQSAISETAKEIEELGIRDAFVAAVPSPAADSNEPHLIGGFHFQSSPEAARKLIEQSIKNPGERETIDYQQHKIDLVNFGMFQVAEVYDGQWFFAAGNVDDLKALLDRADKRAIDPKSLLAEDEIFRGAMAQVARNYALAIYLRPQALLSKLAKIMPNQSAATGQQSVMAEIHAFAATTRFENGKIHDVIFVAAPDWSSNAKLTRDSLKLGTGDTFLYLASVVDFSKQIALLDPTIGTGFIGGGLQKVADALARAQIGMNEWQGAFGSEAGALADWPVNAHWPSGVAVFPVKDMERAKSIASILAHALDEDASWIESDRNGVHYITMQSAPGFLVLRPTIAVSDRMMVVGLDPGSVDAVVQRGGSTSSGLAGATAYKSAAASVPSPTSFFAYLDLPLLYARLDATVRPILIMGAAFMPGVNNYVDLNRVPPVEVVTKHLSPIVSSQHYTDGGYVVESVGPITLNHAGLTLLLLSGVGPHFGWPGMSSLPFTPAPAHRPGGWKGKGFNMPPSPSPAPSATP